MCFFIIINLFYFYMYTIDKDFVDNNFNYYSLFRFIILQKSCKINNCMLIPKINKNIFYFCLNYIDDIDTVSIYNYFYLFRFFFGKKAFFTKEKVLFSLRKYYYTFKICILFEKKEVYFPISIYINEFQNLLLDEFVGSFSYSPLSSSFVIRIFDMTLFMEKKTNLGLFHLQHCLNLKFFLVGGSFNDKLNLLRCFKLNF